MCKNVQQTYFLALTNLTGYGHLPHVHCKPESISQYPFASLQKTNSKSTKILDCYVRSFYKNCAERRCVCETKNDPDNGQIERFEKFKKTILLQDHRSNMLVLRKRSYHKKYSC